MSALQRSSTLGCGPGGCSCGCGSKGMGAAPTTGRYPNISKVLSDYVNAQLAAKHYFWISPTLNSSAVAQSGFGDSSLTPAGATSVGNAVDSTANSIGDALSSLWTGITNVVSTPFSQGGDVLAQMPADNSQLPAQPATATGPQGPIPQSLLPSIDVPTSSDAITAAGINLPSTLTGPTINAAAADIFGGTSGKWIIGAAAALFLVVILSTSRRPARR